MEANRIEEKIYKYGADILASEGMQKEKTFVQHGSITCYDHSLRVAEKSLELAEKCSAYIDERSLVRGQGAELGELQERIASTKFVIDGRNTITIPLMIPGTDNGSVTFKNV